MLKYKILKSDSNTLSTNTIIGIDSTPRKSVKVHINCAVAEDETEEEEDMEDTDNETVKTRRVQMLMV